MPGCCRYVRHSPVAWHKLPAICMPCLLSFCAQGDDMVCEVVT